MAVILRGGVWLPVLSSDHQVKTHAYFFKVAVPLRRRALCILFFLQTHCAVLSTLIVRISAIQRKKA